MTEAETKEWHRLRMEYLVYYYDPLWAAMWGRSGEADSYLSLGTKPFPIKPGQRILVEGLIFPAKGMSVDEPKVTVLADSAPVEVLSTRGDIGDTQRFNKRVVTVEGYVTRQAARDANHQELELEVEGRNVLVQLLLGSGELAPQVNGSLVRVKGVYFARNEPTWVTPKLEIWVPSIQDIEVLSQLSRAENFLLLATPISQLAGAGPGKLVRLTGTVLAQQPGRSLTIRDETGSVTFPTTQTQVVEPKTRVEVIGYPLPQGSGWSLGQALYRRELELITSLDKLHNVSNDRRNEAHRIQLEFVVYYFDPDWKVLWGRSGETEGFMGLGDYSFALKPGQKIHVDGLIVPAKSLHIDEPRIKVLAEGIPLPAVSTRGNVGNTAEFDKRLALVEGYVDRQERNDARHFEFDLITEGRTITVRQLLKEDELAPNLEGAIVETKGVYSASSDPTGGRPKIELWVPNPQDTIIKGTLAQDKQFEQPVTAIDALAAAPPDRTVCVSGIVRGQQPGKSLTIRDNTGQLTVLTAQTMPVQLGESVEAIGLPGRVGAEWQLQEGLYRRAKSASSGAGSVPLAELRLAAQLRELSHEEAGRRHPVYLSGIVTWASPEADFFFVHDHSGGVCVFHPPERNSKVIPGAKVDVVGTSAVGKFTPVVMASSVATGARLDAPEAKQVTLEQAWTGVEDSQWIAMSGYVRELTYDGPWARLKLTTSAGEFTAFLSWKDQLARLIDSVVRVRGVCSVLTNAKRQLTGIQLWVPSEQFLEIEEAKPADPFSVRLRSIVGLRQFNTLQDSNRRVRTSGVVVYHQPGYAMQIQEGNDGLLVLSRDTVPLALGDRVEVVGFPGREGGRVVLREGVYRRLGAGTEPAPLAISTVDPVDVELDGRLVRIQAVLLDPGAKDESSRLILQVNKNIFEALLDPKKAATPPNWVSGCKVELTGVYQVRFDEYKRPYAAQLQLRSQRDLRVLSQPSWLTVGRVLTATGILAIGLVLGFGWVVALRRRVSQQTGQIREQEESEKAARLDAALARASKLESLGVLAGGIAHDFNNLLTVIMGNLSLAKLDPRIEAETVECLQESERAAQRARDLTQQLITFAKGGEPVRAVTVLPGVVREATQFALHGSKVRCDYDLASDVWAADVDKGQIGQVVHNIIINATHAMPGGGVIRISLRNEEIAPGARPSLAPGSYLRLTIADSGTGIEPELLPRIFDPYFTTKAKGSGLGLATVYSIIKKHRGHIEVESKVGKGTTFHIWLPAIAALPTVVDAAQSQPPQPARVLFMDDEATIRSMAGAIFRRMGLEYTVVPDGTAVLREYAAARTEGRPYTLVMLDLTVPGGMGGAEAMEKLQQLDPEVRAIVSSGYSSDPVMANYRAYGFQAIVSKPYELSEFVKTVSAVLPDRFG